MALRKGILESFIMVKNKQGENEVSEDGLRFYEGKRNGFGILTVKVSLLLIALSSSVGEAEPTSIADNEVMKESK